MLENNKNQIHELRSTLGKMEIALGSISDAIVWTDRSGRIQWCNKSFDEMVGQVHIAILGNRLMELLPLKEHGTLLPEEAHPASVVLRGKKDTSGYFECDCGGKKLFVEFVGRYLGITASDESAVMVIRDLTGKKELDQIKLQSAALHHAANAIAITDKDGLVMWVNSSFTLLTGYELEEVYERNLNILNSGKHDESFFRGLWQTILSGEVWEGETVNRKKDGSLYVEQQTIAPVLDENGQITNYIAIKQDISKRKQAEEELSHYRGRLEQMVVEKTSELKKAQGELVNRALEAGMSQMAAIGLHNIGNAISPLNVFVEKMKSGELKNIMGYLQKCHGDLKSHMSDLGSYVSTGNRGRQVFDYMGELIHSLDDFDKEQFAVLEKMETALSYISQILTYQQHHAGRSHELRERVDLNGLVEETIRLQTSSLEKRGIAIKRNYAESKPILMINKNRLMQVIVNLIKNSYEALDLKWSGSEKKILKVVTFVKDDSLGFEIIDNGIGIDPREVETLFELGKSRKNSSGFGLYYCKVFVEANNGELVFSSPGVGKGASVKAAFNTRPITR